MRRWSARQWLAPIVVIRWAMLLCACFNAEPQNLYIISTVAGSGAAKFVGEGGPASAAILYCSDNLASDAAGNIYIAERYYDRVLRVTPGGAIRTVAGAGEKGYSGDGLPALEARLNGPRDVVVDGSGNIFIADSGNHRVRKVTRDGIIRTAAGTGQPGSGGEGGLATQAQLNTPIALALDQIGGVYISDSGNSLIRRVSPDGVIRTVAGVGLRGVGISGSPALLSPLLDPRHLLVDGSSDIYLTEPEAHIVRKVTSRALVYYAGTGFPGFSGDVGPATDAQLAFPQATAVDSSGNVYISDRDNQRIRRVTVSGRISTFAGTGISGAAGDDGPALAAQLSFPGGLAMDGAGNLYVAEQGSRKIRKITAAGLVSTVAGAGQGQLGDGGSAASAYLRWPLGMAFDEAGDLYIADAGHHRVRKVTPAGVITTVAGTGLPGFSGEGRPATAAQLNQPQAVAVDGAGNLYIADLGNQRIRRVNAAGIIYTVAGNGQRGYAAEGEPALSARLADPLGLALDAGGNLYIADSGNHRVRKLAPDGIITTVAGDGTDGFTGDGGPATQAQLSSPAALALDRSGNLYIAESGIPRIRKLNPLGQIGTVPGSSRLTKPRALALDAAGNFYIAEPEANVVRRLAPTGQLLTLVGTGEGGFLGDGDLASAAQLNRPSALVMDGSGALYIADTENHRIRKLTPAQIASRGVVNAASFTAGPVAPGEIVTIYGEQLGPPQLTLSRVNPPGFLDTLLAETRVLFDGVAAPLVWVMADKVSVIVPYGVAGRTSTKLQVEFRGTKTNVITLPVAATAPGIFTAASTGAGQAALFNEDGTLNGPSNQADKGSIVVFFATGEGQTSPPGVDGKLALTELPTPVAGVSVRIGGAEAQVLYAGAVPTFAAGLMQVNARVPAGAPSGAAVPLSVTVGSASSQQGVTLAIR